MGSYEGCVLIPSIIFVLNIALTSAVYIQVRFRLDFFMEANHMNPD